MRVKFLSFFFKFFKYVISLIFSILILFKFFYLFEFKGLYRVLKWTVCPIRPGLIRDRGPVQRSGPTVGQSFLHPKPDHVDSSRVDPWTGSDCPVDRAGSSTGP
jgi:hypothetical protein